MGLEFINQHVAKIMAAVEDGDSINQISRKTGSSYSYTYEWIQRLEDHDIINQDHGIHVQDTEFQEQFEELTQAVFTRDLSLVEAYLLPNFSEMDYRFSKTDAVYIWTKGGYQIGRNQDDYPIFIDIHEDEVDRWKEFFQSYGLECVVEHRLENGEPGIYYVLNPQSDGFRSEWVENSKVVPLTETVEWAQNYRANFQPALEMLDEMHNLGLGVEYRERNVIEE